MNKICKIELWCALLILVTAASLNSTQVIAESLSTKLTVSSKCSSYFRRSLYANLAQKKLFSRPTRCTFTLRAILTERKIPAAYYPAYLSKEFCGRYCRNFDDKRITDRNGKVRFPITIRSNRISAEKDRFEVEIFIPHPKLDISTPVTFSSDEPFPVPPETVFYGALITVCNSETSVKTCN